MATFTLPMQLAVRFAWDRAGGMAELKMVSAEL